LIGSYDSQIAFGQSRVLLVWTQLIMPNGRSIVLERQAASGLRTRSTNHWCELLKAAALSTLLGVGTELGSSANDSDIIRTLRRGSDNSLNQTGQQVVRCNLNIQPSLMRMHGGRKRLEAALANGSAH
jgi:type IV secretory pathway VirB10-like protein